MADVKALQLLSEQKSLLSSALQTPRNEDEAEQYLQRSEKPIDDAMLVLEKIGKYAKTISEEMEGVKGWIQESSKAMSAFMLKLLDQFIVVKGPIKFPLKTCRTLEIVRKLQEIEMRKQKLAESILKTQAVLDQVEATGILTLENLSGLKNAIAEWRDIDFDKLKEEKRKKEKEARIKELEDKRRNEERELERKQKEEEEEKERKRKEEEESRKDEEKRRKERFDRKKIEEEEKRRKDEEERKKRDQEEREKKEEHERLRKMEERRRLDPKTWNSIAFLRKSDGLVDGDLDYHKGMCCKVASVSDSVKQDDIECLAIDEVSDCLDDGERFASSVVSIKSKCGKIQPEVPVRIFLPQADISDTSSETIVKVKTPGNGWVENDITTQCKDADGIRLVGTDVPYIEDMQAVAISRRRLQTFIVDQSGADVVSKADQNIRVIIQRDTFSSKTEVRFQVNQVDDTTLNELQCLHTGCDHVGANSSIINLAMLAVSRKQVELRVSKTNSQGSDSTVFVATQEPDSSWKHIDVTDSDNADEEIIKLPADRSKYVVARMTIPTGTPISTSLHASNEFRRHLNETVVCVLFRQKKSDPTHAVIHVLSRLAVRGRMEELVKLGFDTGPGTSKDFCVNDGQSVLIYFTGNVGMSMSGGKLSLRYNRYIDSAKQGLVLHVIDKYKQRDLEEYLGHLRFQVEDAESTAGQHSDIKGNVPVSLPKGQISRAPSKHIRVQFPSHLNVMAKFLGWKLSEEPGLLEKVLKTIESSSKVLGLLRNARRKCGTDEMSAEVVDTVIVDWMKVKPKQDDKMKPLMDALDKCGLHQLGDTCQNVIAFHRDKLTDSWFEQLASSVPGDRTQIGLRLGLPRYTVDKCIEENQGSPHDEMFHLLLLWRTSDAAIRLETNAYDWLVQQLNL